MPNSKPNWYFDFISPFAYLQFETLMRNTDLGFNPIPVLFAGLLNHWENKGPAEIPAKRIFTYRHAVWLGQKYDIPLRMPPAHPFNPLKLLRLAIVKDNALPVVQALFRYIWAEGKSIDDEASWQALMDKLDIADAAGLSAQEDVKAKLRQNTEEAIAKNVFGVPTLEIKGELFWGFDATDMAIAYMQNPDLFGEGDMTNIDSLPEAARRR